MRGFILALIASLFSATAIAAPGDRAVGVVPGAFDVSASGAATYSIPLRLSPGSAGTAPHLGLTYNSNAAGGPLGAGWSLSGLSAITRGPKDRLSDGRIRGIELDDDDALYLDGERLIEVASSGAGAAKRVEYRKEFDDYSKIVMSGAGLATASISVQTKGGATLVFDGSNGSRIRLQDGTVLLLALSRIVDTAGNFIEFRYEQNGYGDYNVNSVRYTGHQRSTPGGVVIDRSPFASVEFTYENAPRAVEGYIAGRKVRRDRRLKSVWVRVTDQSLDAPGATYSTVARYSFDYTDTETLGRYLLTKVHQASEDGTEIEPTELTYTPPQTSWSKAPYQLPIIPLAKQAALAQGYRFAKLSPGAGPSSDILFSVAMAGKVQAFAYTNVAAVWTKQDALAPPFAFASEDGADLGGLVVDLNGDGRSDLVQAYDADGQTPLREAWTGKADGWDSATGYRLPFALSKNGKRVAEYRLVYLSNQSRPDLAFTSGGSTGYLTNTGTGWVADPNHSLPATLDAQARFMDVDCDGRAEFMTPITEGGVKVWAVWRYTAAGWSRLDPKFALPAATVAATAGMAAVDLNQDQCRDVVVSTPALKAAYTAGPSGWAVATSKVPSFLLTDTDGSSLDAQVVDLNGDALPDLLASRKLKGGKVVQLAELQGTAGWTTAGAWVTPPLSDDEAAVAVPFFLTDLNGDALVDLAMPSNDRARFGRVLLNSGAGFVDAPDFMPTLAFGRRDERDEGVRFVDLNADGLLDVVYRRDTTSDGKTEIVAGALINTGAGWKPEAGLVPPLALASDKISGSPAQFLDVDNDGYPDLLYSYDFSDGTSTRKFYHNEPAAGGGRLWLEVAGSGYLPPAPFARQGGGDLGARLVDLDGDGRIDLLYSSLTPKSSAPPPAPCMVGSVCDWNRDHVKSSAYLNDGTKWVAASTYSAPLPFVALRDASSDATIDLGVQTLDLNGDRLPDLIAAFKHPDDPWEIREVYLNSGAGWTRSAASAAPILLDEPRRDSNLLIQWVDVNGDGFADLVASKRSGGANNSETYLSTGRDFVATTDFKIPLEAISEKAGDPSYRILDLNGDGLPDIFYSRETDATPVQGAFLNNGSKFAAAPAATVAGLPTVVDKDGRDLGVRIFDLNADGLVDVVQAYAATEEVEIANAAAYLNGGTRADLLVQLRAGYGLNTSITYQPLGKPLAAADINGPWSKVYEPAPSTYPLVSAVPATYAVARVAVSDPQGHSLAFSYRFGAMRFDALTMRSAGFGWRESYNEASGVLSRQEFLQSAAFVGRTARDTTCRVPKAVVKSDNLCPGASAGLPLPAGALRLTEVEQQWTLADPAPAAGSLESKVRQVRISGAHARSWELTGVLKGNEVTTIGYDDAKPLLDRHGNVLRTLTQHADGSSVETANEYKDDTPGWLLDRLAKSTITKLGDPSAEPGGRRKDIRITEFTYEPQTGLLATSTADPGSSLAVRTKYTRDDSGNITATEVSAAGLLPKRTVTHYDAQARFIVLERTLTASRNFDVIYERDLVTGQPVSITDPNLQVTNTKYDDWGRLSRTVAATGVAARVEYLLPSSLGDPGALTGLNAAYALRSSVDGLPPTLELRDAKGRVMRTVTEGFSAAPGSRPIHVDRRYDDLGRVSQTSLPYDRADPTGPKWSRMKYDTLNRVVVLDGPRGDKRTFAYSVLPNGQQRTVAKDAAGRSTSIDVDARGLRRTVVDARNGSLKYAYDGAGRLEKTTGATGQVRTTKYDLAGRITTVVDPDLGLWKYDYDAYGQLVRQTDAKGQVKTFSYDELGRILKRTSADSSVAWEYDTAAYGVGKITKVVDVLKSERLFEYDQYGRPNAETLSVGAEVFRTSTDLDLYGRPVLTTYPTADGIAGLAVRRHYDSKGFLHRVTDQIGATLFWEALQTDASGRVTSERYGNGTSRRTTFDASGRTITSTVDSLVPGQSPVLGLSLQYDAVGNLARRKEAVNGRDETFSYDELNRLTGLQNADGSKEAYAYDAGGRITFKSGIGDYRYHDQVGGAWQPANAVLQTKVGGVVTAYAYDANGNRAEDGKRRYTWTVDNRLRKVELKSDPTTFGLFDYDPFGDRIRQTAQRGSHRVETVYVGAFERARQFEVKPDSAASLKESRYTYYVGNGSEIFLSIFKDKSEANPGTVKQTSWFLHKDQLGNVLRITDQSGKLAARYWYDPWGRVSAVILPGGDALKGPWARLFGGHEFLEMFELVHMNGRVYDPAVGQFLSADPVGDGLAHTQVMSRYQYAQNNPLRFVDPSGYGIWEDFTGAVSDFVEGAAGGVTHIINEAGKWLQENWREVVIVAAAIITVATVGSACPATCPIIAGMAAGAVSGATAAALYGGSTEDILVGAIKGAIIGGISAGLFDAAGTAFASKPAEYGIAAHGMIGGTMSVAQGGDFTTGFLSAAITKGVNTDPANSYSANLVRSAVVGGTVAAVTGGKFANGAVIGAFSYAFNDAIHFDGKAVTYENDNGEVLCTCDATSGRPGVTDVTLEDQGPIPPGDYSLDSNSISHPETAWGRFKRSLTGDWGEYRAPMTPMSGTETHNRSGFFMHGGKTPGSAGCIDIGSCEAKMFPLIKNYGKPIPVHVKYPPGGPPPVPAPPRPLPGEFGPRRRRSAGPRDGRIGGDAPPRSPRRRLTQAA